MKIYPDYKLTKSQKLVYEIVRDFPDGYVYTSNNIWYNDLELLIKKGLIKNITLSCVFSFKVVKINKNKPIHEDYLSKC